MLKFYENASKRLLVVNALAVPLLIVVEVSPFFSLSGLAGFFATDAKYWLLPLVMLVWFVENLLGPIALTMCIYLLTYFLAWRLHKKKKYTSSIVASCIFAIGLILFRSGYSLYPFVEKLTSTPPPVNANVSKNEFCGGVPALLDAPTFPSIGCFYLTPQHEARAIVLNHEVKVAVDEADHPIFTVDGILVRDVTGPDATESRTNLPFVRAAGQEGYTFCENASRESCSTLILVHWHDPNKSILFVVWQCLPAPYSECVNTQEHLAYEKSRFINQTIRPR